MLRLLRIGWVQIFTHWQAQLVEAKFVQVQLLQIQLEQAQFVLIQLVQIQLEQAQFVEVQVVLQVASNLRST